MRRHNGLIRHSLCVCLLALGCQQDSAVEPHASDAPKTGTAAATTHDGADATTNKAGSGGDNGAKNVSAGDGTGGTAATTGGNAGAGTPATTPPAAAGQPKVKKRVTFAGSRGDTIPGYLWLPARQTGQKFPAILLMYGIKGNKDDGAIGQAADILNDDGFVCITIDWPGTGERGNIGNTDRIVNADVKEWTVGDYEQTYNFLAQQPEVDTNRMGYVGASMGAMTGIDFAAREPRVKAMVAIVPIPNPLWGGDDPSVRIGALSPRPVLCVSTDDNSDFSATVCANVGGGGQKQALPGGHELQGFRAEVVTVTKQFLDQHLKQ